MNIPFGQLLMWAEYLLRLRLLERKEARKKRKHVAAVRSVCLRFVTGKEKADKDVPSATSVIYFEVENLEESYSKLKNEGVEFITEPREQGWGGKTAVMLDPDRNLIVLSQV